MSATKLIDPSSFIRVPMVEEEDKTCHTCKKEYEVEEGRGGYEGHKCFECFNLEEEEDVFTCKCCGEEDIDNDDGVDCPECCEAVCDECMIADENDGNCKTDRCKKCDIRVPMVERPECAGCCETDCENERCDNPRCDGGCIGSCNCARCDGDFCTNCEIGGDGEDENDWVCDNCVDDLVEEKYEQRCKALGEKPGDDYHVCDNLIHGDCPDGSVWHSDNVLKYNDEDLCLCPKCFFGDERKY